MNSTTTTMPAAVLAAALSCGATAQAEPHFVTLSYPEDRNVPVAVVAGKPHTLGDLVAHIDERHYPGFAEALEKRPEFQRMLQSPFLPPWVRHYADIKALEFVTKDSDVDLEALDATISGRLKRDFEAWLENYIEQRRKNNHPTELSQVQVNRLLTDFQLKYGLSTELQGWLDHLRPQEYNRKELQDFFTANARAFGGQVTIAHILIQHRDGGTGILLREEGRGRASARLADVKARLKDDGSNFGAIARLFSEDSKTANDGGKLAGIRRFDDRLPAELCRAAWRLRDGEVSDVVETRYGWHLVQRLEFNQNIFVLFTDDAIPSIKIVMQRAEQEDLMFDARKKAEVELLL